ncbi:hypothetical protein ACS5PU_21175 [Pedobacter sp. GSP4]|uniref:hypothetical protein n=1 Tax=Pedobacter sp. GSP4 TaxID=3453716 RepID=UPI003EEE9407
MKKIFNRIHFGAVAVLIGASLVLTQSAFTPAKQNRLHEQFGRLGGAWVKLSDYNPEEYEIQCNEVENPPYCKGYFDTTTNPNPAPSDTPLSTEPIDYGMLTITPIQ